MPVPNYSVLIIAVIRMDKGCQRAKHK